MVRTLLPYDYVGLINSLFLKTYLSQLEQYNLRE